VTTPTAQEASGSTIVSAHALRLDRCGHAYALERPIATPEAVDAAGPVDAQTRPPRLGKRRTVSHSAHRHLVFLIREKRQADSFRASDRPATITRVPRRSPGGLIRHPFVGRNSCR
jgi:hypothetical protein